MSAKYGLLVPETVVGPYNLALKDLSPEERRRWGVRVVDQIHEAVGELAGLSFEIHAGHEYVEAIEFPLCRVGASFGVPLRSLRVGEQLQWYDERVREAGR